jgi:hypothetical protein
MNVIIATTGVIAVIASFALPVGLVMLCRKQWRKRGIKLSLASLGVVIVTSGVGAVLNPKAVKHEPTQAATQTKASEQSSTPDGVSGSKPAAKKQDAHNAKLAGKTQRMTDSIISALRRYYNFEAQPLIPGKPFCRKGGIPSCNLVAETFDIRVYGAGIVEIPTTTQSSHANYREMCAAVFSAISGSNLDFAAEAIEGAFLKASQTGSFKHDVANTQITISQGSSGVLECRFFKYGD